VVIRRDERADVVQPFRDDIEHRTVSGERHVLHEACGGEMVETAASRA
jgi:hypothetical protein